MDNFSLRSSQEDTFVKALEVDVLFDQNTVFKLQVTISCLALITFLIFASSTFCPLWFFRFLFSLFFWCASLISIFFVLPTPLYICVTLFLRFLHFPAPLLYLHGFISFPSFSLVFYSPPPSFNLHISLFRVLFFLFSLPHPLLFYWHLMFFLQHSIITNLIILILFPFSVVFVFSLLHCFFIVYLFLILPRHIAFIYYKCIYGTYIKPDSDYDGDEIFDCKKYEVWD